MELKWLTRQMILAMHDEAVVVFGGLPGVRDLGLLDSAMDRPKTLSAYGDEPSLFDLAAALCFGIVKNHPFLDGNKRTGIHAALDFLEINGIDTDSLPEMEAYDAMIQVANHEMDRGGLAQFFRAAHTVGIYCLVQELGLQCLHC